MNVVGLFPTPLIMDNVKNDLDIKELSSIIALSADKSQLILNGENGNAFYKDTRILNAYPNLLKFLKDKVNHFLHNIYGEDTTLTITQSWLNVNPTGSYHHVHNHKNSIISGVLYIECDKDSGDFRLYKNDAACRTIGGVVNRHNTFTYDFVKFTPEKFDLYLFPSHMKHSVDENKSDTTRLSLAFNTFYVGELDNIWDSLSQLKIENAF